MSSMMTEQRELGWDVYREQVHNVLSTVRGAYGLTSTTMAWLERKMMVVVADSYYAGAARALEMVDEGLSGSD
jgi:hypothetical protein